MSVIVADRTESKFEAIVFSVELHDMLIELMQRNFGIKDFCKAVRNCSNSKEPAIYLYLISDFKSQINHIASLLTNNIRAANSLYPTTMHEYETRRDLQNTAIINCEQLMNELQRIVSIFDVYINSYKQYIEAIDKEIKLIKRWRQRDNQIKLHLM